MKKVNDKFNNRNVFKLYPHNWKRPSNWWDNIKDFFRGFKYSTLNLELDNTVFVTSTQSQKTLCAFLLITENIFIKT